jgi:beta-xylosidase
MADPYVLEHDGLYWAYGTAPRDERTGREFRILRSPNLRQWEYVGGALVPLPEPWAQAYWAPEVIHHGGRFLMFYSAGGPHGQGHGIRVAVAGEPSGPFHDLGPLLHDEAFSIDAHPFVDSATGRCYLYYARDVLDGACPGTGIAAVEMASDFLGVIGDRIDIVRPSSSWHVFQQRREWLGRLWERWYTVEGPTVRRRGGKYWMTYSGGPFWSAGYGVGCAVADAPLGPWTDLSIQGPTVLRTVPGRLHGPGHNSIVVGPDGAEYIVYHAWDREMTARRMHVARLTWTTSGPVAEMGIV